jgi:hypothetical protein
MFLVNIIRCMTCQYYKSCFSSSDKDPGILLHQPRDEYQCWMCSVAPPVSTEELIPSVLGMLPAKGLQRTHDFRISHHLAQEHTLTQAACLDKGLVPALQLHTLQL